ncbi:hypothetical protein M9Y10_042020 [Tritrichomonas musculus]|uniref:VWFA domain-containing protein n=1 Tax=Tritrichomonas musculus TaxID=1915356 RepID=A0ABR2K608_9EUKA
MKCVASLFGDSISGRMEKMPPIYPMDLRFDDIKESFKNLINNEDNPIYNNLKEELRKIKHLQDAFRHYYNSEGDIGNASKGFTNFEGEDGDRKKGTGDIVIDCGYTKCFANLTENGTYRHIQNIARWTMNMETHISSGFNPKEWRPKAVTHSINLSEEWKYPLVQGTNEVDIIFCSDATGSMGSWLDAAKTRSKSIADASCSNYPDKSFRFGSIFYKQYFKSR